MKLVESRVAVDGAGSVVLRNVVRVRLGMRDSAVPGMRIMMMHCAANYVVLLLLVRLVFRFLQKMRTRRVSKIFRTLR